MFNELNMTLHFYHHHSTLEPVNEPNETSFWIMMLSSWWNEPSSTNNKQNEHPNSENSL